MVQYGREHSKRDPLEDRVTSAEATWAYFTAEHNIPFSVSDHFTKIVKVMFPTCPEVQKFSSGRTKTTQVVKRALAPEVDREVESLCSGPFSILCDESNTRGADKCLVILVRVYDAVRHQTMTKFLDMPICNRPSGEQLFNTIDDVFKKRGLDWGNVIGYCSDNASVMVGRNNSVLSRIRLHQPSVFDLGCVCHLANLCAGHAVRQLPIPINDMLVDVFYHFKHSSVRKENFKEFQEFTDTVPEKILKHATTRWLSLEKCIQRTLTQWPALQSYFSSNADAEKPGKVKLMRDFFESHEARLYCLFLEFILAPLNEFNILFQADAVKIIFLDKEMKRLLRKFLGKFVKVAAIGQQQLTDVRYKDIENQLPDQILAVGMRVRAYLAENEDDVEPATTARFFRHVRLFYEAVVWKMLNKFPFNNKVLTNLLWLHPNPESRKDVSTDSVLQIAEQFPGVVKDLDELHEEFVDFQLSDPKDLPRFDGENPDVDQFWGAVSKQKTVTGKLQFPQLSTLAQALLTIPNSNADSERTFSIVRKIHTESRNSMNNETLCALLSVKINNDSHCYEKKMSEAVLKDTRSACTEYNKMFD
ncbi:hypothetical protein ScPMuIL_010847 [Solemya velum]